MKLVRYMGGMSLIAFLSACGGGTDTPTQTITGTFVDDPVQGLDYQCSSGLTGTTNAKGEYQCRVGDQVSFSLAGVAIGTTTAQSELITPYTFFPDAPEAAINLARLLQSVDTDGDPNNGVILLHPAPSLPAELDFASPDFDQAVSVNLISAHAAQQKLNTNIVKSGGTVPDTIADVIAPVITLAGDSPLTLYQGNEYKEPGATANDAIDGEVSVTITGTVDASKIGEYTLTYTAKDKAGNQAKTTRTVKVIAKPDTTAPVITLTGDNPLTLYQGGEYKEPGATANDAIDSEVSVTITGTVDTSKVGEYTLTYTAKDKAGNQAKTTRTVKVIAKPDTTAPVITLTGDSPLTLYQGDEYKEPGATANDAIDGELSVTITGTVDTSKIGEYALTYTAKDKAGNQSKTTRTVKVIAKPDTTAPATPILLSTVLATNQDTFDIKISGEIAAAIWVDGTQQGNIASNGQQSVSLNTSGDDGIKSFSITLKDAKDNESNALLVKVTKDTLPPNTNAKLTTLQTAEASPSLSGQLPSGDNDSDTSAYTVTLTINGEEYTATNNQKGQWRLPANTLQALAEGFYHVTIKTTDAAGNSSETVLNNVLEINRSGFLIDSALEGIKYISGTYNGYTDKNGLFKYENDQEVYFYIGDENTGIALGSAKVKADPYASRKIISLFDLAGTQDESNQRVINMGRFLQSLDSDNDVSNGILIDQRTKESIALLGLNNRVSFDVSPEQFAANNDIDTLFNDLAGHFGEHRGLISIKDAQAHLVSVRDNTLPIQKFGLETSRGDKKKTVILTGTFKSINGVVEGLDYRSGNQFGRTNDKGEFTYEEGKNIKFYIYELALGTTQSQAVITPADLVPSTSFNHPKPRNIIRLLNAVDAINDDQKITIDQSVRSALETYRSQIDLNLPDGKANPELGIQKGNDEFGAQFEEFEIGREILDEVSRLRAED